MDEDIRAGKLKQLPGANLEDFDLSGVDLCGINLAGATLVGQIFPAPN